MDCGMDCILVDSIWKDGAPIKANTEYMFNPTRARFKMKDLEKGKYLMRGRVLRSFEGNTQENPFGVRFEF
jgi:hypothetical protein